MSSASHDARTLSKRVHDLRNARDGLATLLSLMQKGFSFHTDARGTALLQSMEKYIGTISHEIETLEAQTLQNERS
jgi:hypothetical protein